MTLHKKSIENADHYIWGDGCEGWHLLASETLSVIRERMAPGKSEQLHFHSRAQQVFFILSGEAHFDIGQELIKLSANESLHIPSNTPHRIFNAGSTDLHFIVISEPRSHGDRVEI